MDNAPASNPATPVSTMGGVGKPAAPRPSTSARWDTRPSLRPNTEARSPPDMAQGEFPGQGVANLYLKHPAGGTDR